jgi:predicted Zn-dependent protease
VRSETINAFALPGGYVVVFTGLLKHAQGPDEVAGVLAHEVQHVVLRHGLERMVASLGLTAVVTILTGNEQGLVGLAKRLGLQLATLKFGRDQETAADVGGVRMLYRAHINPDAMVAFFLGLADRDPAQIELLSTHPMSAARAERLNAEIKALGPLEATAWPFDWSAARGSL